MQPYYSQSLTGHYVVEMLKYVLDDKGHSYEDLINKDMVLISENLFVIVRK